MKKAFLCLSAIVLSLNFVWINPITGSASKIETKNVTNPQFKSKKYRNDKIKLG
ncbi:hypothetical protein, partial [Listeria monocytogenes]|uniref:hypothetical protein n=1 Tax=Listeria monocytogenes TaxID=1639 RepID=UPI002B252149